MITVKHAGPPTLIAGILKADGVETAFELPSLREKTAELVARRSTPLSDGDDAFRKSVRDVFRNGRYKPTGRGKPASEYLLRSAAEGTFPQINAPVDICNYISLKSLMPISLWDLDLASTNVYCVRLGRADEEYVFNRTGQTIALEDLIVGCAVDEEHPDGIPIVNAVKDSMKTKTTENSSRIGAIVYGPSGGSDIDRMSEICSEFATWLGRCGPDVEADYRILHPGDDIQY